MTTLMRWSTAGRSGRATVDDTPFRTRYGTPATFGLAGPVRRFRPAVAGNRTGVAVREPAGLVPVRPVLGPAVLLGLGLGGFVDGILLHQILRWHHMVSSVRGADLTANLVADGLFHAATWLAVVAGLFWMWDRWRLVAAAPPWTMLVGGLLLGFGAFNLVEGTVDHHLLAVHHVRYGPGQTAYDVGFLLSGVVLMLAGGLLYRAGRRAAASRPVRPR